MWSSQQIARYGLCLTAMAFQRGNAMVLLHGYTHCSRNKTNVGNEEQGREGPATAREEHQGNGGHERVDAPKWVLQLVGHEGTAFRDDGV